VAALPATSPVRPAANELVDVLRLADEAARQAAWATSGVGLEWRDTGKRTEAIGRVIDNVTEPSKLTAPTSRAPIHAALVVEG
jgi:hypothetical protein